jgi:hypothetical protein
MIPCVVGRYSTRGGEANIPAGRGTVGAVGGPVAAGGRPVGQRNIVQVALLNTPLLILLAAFKQYPPKYPTKLLNC